MDILEYDDPEAIAALLHFVGIRKMQWAELEESAAVSKNTLRNIRSNFSSPSSATLRQICEALGVRRSEFFEEGERIVDELRKKREEELAERPRLLKQVEETLEKVEKLTQEDLEQGGISEEEHRRYVLSTRILLSKMKTTV